MPEWAKPNEPCPLYWDGKLIVITRSWGEPSRDADGNARYVQLWSETGWPPFKAKFTNVRSASQDTCDIDYNPVTKRFEVIHPNRRGAGPGRLNNGKMSLLLWSIDPEALFAGSSDWRYDCTFFSRQGGLLWANRTPLTACTLPAPSSMKKQGSSTSSCTWGFPPGRPECSV